MSDRVPRNEPVMSEPEPSARAHRVLVVDDEPNVHVALARQLKVDPYEVFTAESSDEALQLLGKHTFAVIVADYLMPKMNGIDLLAITQKLYPDTVRILFTAYNEANIAIEAINKGGIYRYIIKPWNGKEIRAIIREAVDRFQLAAINRKLFDLTKVQNQALLEKTKEIELKNRALKKLYEESNLNYLKSIEIFSSLLEVFDPWLMQHAKRVAELARLVCAKLDLEEKDRNHVEFSALLHDLGLIGLPKILSRKKFSLCSEDEKRLIKQHSQIGQNLVGKDPKFSTVAAIIRSHHERYDGKGWPDGLAGEDIPFGARIVAVIDAYDSLLYPANIYDRSSPESVKGYLYNSRGTRFDPRIVDTFLLALAEHGEITERGLIPVDQLRSQEEDLFT